MIVARNLKAGDRIETGPYGPATVKHVAHRNIKSGRMTIVYVADVDGRERGMAPWPFAMFDEPDDRGQVAA